MPAYPRGCVSKFAGRSPPCFAHNAPRVRAARPRWRAPQRPSSHSFIRLEGESGNDDLTLLIFEATIWDYYGKPYLLNGGSGFDTCTTNVEDEQVKIISCEDHNEPLPS